RLRPSRRSRRPDPQQYGPISMAQAHAEQHDPNVYFVPHSSRWPLFASVGLFVTMLGLASWFNEISWGKSTFFVGILMLAAILFKWFADVVLESVSGYY